MSFQVKAKLVEFLGDLEKYPCHFGHNVGDTVIFDGEKYVGRLCPDVWPLLAPKVYAMHCMGPRYIEPNLFHPFCFEPPTVRDPSRKKYDGLGYKTIFETRYEPKYHIANLIPPTAFTWPPQDGTGPKVVAVICPDYRSSAVFILEAFDLSDKGFDIPYFRRQMVILDRLLKKPGLAGDGILKMFSKKEREEIVPYLGPEILPIFLEELELMGYLDIKDGKNYVTKKGEVRLKTFKKTLTPEEKKALKL
ncbi:MAG: hypothetical protein JW967_03580 [Dehalococcoidales bacterium]|nr:hypothetical protein [Dehalococcoidales bacterium]